MDLPPQDLGDDFEFEADEEALKSILSNGGVTPKLKPKVAEIAPDSRSALTPASKLPNSYKKLQEKFEFFEGRNGAVFYRPRVPSSTSKSGGKAGPAPTQAATGIGRKVELTFQPRRATAKTPLSTKSRRHGHGGHEEQMCQTEKRLMPLEQSLLPPRMSISERKGIPSLEKGRMTTSRLPKLVTAKKALFDNTSAKSQGAEDDFVFAKPLSPSPQPTPKISEEVKGRSMAELILMREGLHGLVPRESLSALLRQSLSKAELDRMFEDDSTANFEAFERRLKTPGKKSSASTRLGGNTEPKTTDDEDLDGGEFKHFEQLQSPSALQTSISLTDLPEETRNEARTDGRVEEELPLVKKFLERSKSDPDLNSKDDNLRSSESVLKETFKALEKFVEEQRIIENEMLKLIEASRLRRETFKLSWGVSPRSINRKRTVKTMIVCPGKINFSSDREEVEQPNSDHCNEATRQSKDEGDKVDRILFEEEKKDPSKLLEEVFSPDKSAKLEELFLSTEQSNGNQEQQDFASRDIEWFGDVFGPEDALDLGAVVEVETEKEDRQEEELFSQKGTNDNFEDDDIEEVDMDMTETCGDGDWYVEGADDFRTPPAAEGTDGNPGSFPAVEKAKCDHGTSAVAEKVPEEEKRSDPATFKGKKNSKKSVGFTVRFTEEVEEQHSDGFSMVKINVPVHIRGQAGNISITERRRRSSSVLHTPTPRRPRSISRRPFLSAQNHQWVQPEGSLDGSDSDPKMRADECARPDSTPSALRSLSLKAHKELASLYFDVDEGNSENIEDSEV